MNIQSVILFMPVLHEGYLRMLKQLPKNTQLYLLDSSFIAELTEHEPAMGHVGTDYTKKILTCLGFDCAGVIATVDDLQHLSGKVLLLESEISRTLSELYLSDHSVEWISDFLRWDRSLVISDNDLPLKVSNDPADMEYMQQAYNERRKSGDWWRQVGAVAVHDGEIVLRAYNRGIPTDHTPYQVGSVRDYLNIGEAPELSPTIHAEQLLLAYAAQHTGISILGASIYVTHFPCAVCATLLAFSGIRKLGVSEGSSNKLGLHDLLSMGVEVVKIDFDPAEYLSHYPLKTIQVEE